VAGKRFGATLRIRVFQQPYFKMKGTVMGLNSVMNDDAKRIIQSKAMEYAKTVALLVPLETHPRGPEGTCTPLGTALRSDQIERDTEWARERLREVFSCAQEAYLQAVGSLFGDECADAALGGQLDEIREKLNGKSTVAEAERCHRAKQSKKNDGAPPPTALVEFLQQPKSGFRRVHPEHRTKYVFEHAHGKVFVPKDSVNMGGCQRALDMISEILREVHHFKDGRVQSLGIRIQS
jgi:hypothetical protein